MKVAVVHSFYTGRSSSGENEVVKAQVKALRSAGHEVRLIARYTDEEEKRRGYKLASVARVATGRGQDPSEELAEFQPDIVHVHNLFPNFGTSWMAQWSDRAVVTLHNFRPICSAATLWRDGNDCTECLDNGVRAALRHRCYRDSLVATIPLAFASRDKGRHQPVLHQIARLVVLNDRAQSIYQDLVEARVDTIPNFVAFGDETGEARDGWLYVGRLTPEKGVRELIEGFPGEEKLRIVGDGPLDAEVRALCETKPNVEFLGRMGKEDVQQAMRRSLGLIIPSLWAEGIPTVALESLACGTPLLVSERCTSAPQLTAGKAGAIYNPSDESSLGCAVSEISSDWRSYESGARRRHAIDYSETTWLARMEALYREVVLERAS